MAKGQMRSTKEARKPKAKGPKKTVPANASRKGIVWRPADAD